MTVSHGLDRTLAELEQQAPEFRAEVQKFLDGLVSHYVFDDGRLVVAHAGMKAEMQGRGSARCGTSRSSARPRARPTSSDCRFVTTGRPSTRGRASVVYGHTPVPEPEWLNRTINIDTGCVFGGQLTALRWPEKELVSVPARQTYADPVRPFMPGAAPSLSAQQANDDLLDIEDVRGKRLVATRLHRNVTVREENAAAALEVMSRFAANPKWLIYLPPTMSPSETSKAEGLLEHPAEAFSPTGTTASRPSSSSRSTWVPAPSSSSAGTETSLASDSGSSRTRARSATRAPGRRFFEDVALERELLAAVRSALDASGFWERFNTDWVCLDCELMPWSARRSSSFDSNASVGTAARVGLGETVCALEAAGAEASMLRSARTHTRFG